MGCGPLELRTVTPDALFERTLAQRFPASPRQNAARLRRGVAHHSASDAFFWGDIDLKWFPEAA
jgi:hypothetical protein